MTKIAVSVIVVSRHRPQALLRCLTGLRQLYYTPFEVIVIADPSGISAIAAAGLLKTIKHAEFDEANISAARNIGLSLASGKVVAFIDDDSVPEPTWLYHLIAPFKDDSVGAAGGFVRGRNGISFQSKAQRVDHLGAHTGITVTDTNPLILAGTPGNAIKTEGTNCAFRRDQLLSMGGFDPAFHFYLDETDVNLRFASQNAKTAIVPLAQVHHGFASSAQRTPQRMPKTLYDIGASLAVFLRKHAPRSEYDTAFKAMRAEQSARLTRHMIAGTCEPRDISKLMTTFEDGVSAGAQRPYSSGEALIAQPSEFKPFETFDQSDPGTVLSGRIWSQNSLRQQAQREVQNGTRVSLFCFSPTALYHKLSFDEKGYWRQTGGLFGKSDRSDALLSVQTLSQRVNVEKQRLINVRWRSDA